MVIEFASSVSIHKSNLEYIGEYNNRFDHDSIKDSIISKYIIESFIALRQDYAKIGCDGIKIYVSRSNFWTTLAWGLP